MKKVNFIFKLTVVTLIQAFIAMDAWCGINIFSPNHSATTLSPQINIGNSGFKEVFLNDKGFLGRNKINNYLDKERIGLNLNKRLTAPIAKGTGWVRVSATPKQAAAFHEKFSLAAEGNYAGEFSGKQYIFPAGIWKKMIAWSRGSYSLGLERQGYFLANNIDDSHIRILDFIPLGTLCFDPVDGVGSQESTTNPATYGIDKKTALGVLGFDCGIQSKELNHFRIIEKEGFKYFSEFDGAIRSYFIIPYHTHFKSETPTQKDIDESKKDKVSFLFSFKSGKGYLYGAGNHPSEVKKETKYTLKSVKKKSERNIWIEQAI